jgi:hypothetical protein
MQAIRPMGTAELRRSMETAYPRPLRAARRAFRRWPRRKRDDAIAEWVAKVWMTWVLDLEEGKDPPALLCADIH